MKQSMLRSMTQLIGMISSWGQSMPWPSLGRSDRPFVDTLQEKITPLAADNLCLAIQRVTVLAVHCWRTINQ